MSNKYSLLKKHQLVEYKGSKCHDCQQSFPDCCYDFDHRDPHKKSFAISRRMGSPIADLIAEADKCDLVCKNCHAIRTLKNPAVRVKLSRAGKGNKNGLGHRHSAETLARMSASHMGHPQTNWGFHGNQHTKKPNGNQHPASISSESQLTS